MKITLSQKELSLAGKALSRILSKRPHLPVLAGIQLKTLENDSLELCSTDLTAGLKIQIPAKIIKSGETIVNGKIFLETINFFDHDETEIELEEKELLLKNGSDRVFIPLINQEFPSFSLSSENKQETDLEFWDSIVKKVSFAASTDQSRPALTGILLRGENNLLQAVCTDGFRLVVLEQTLPYKTFHQKNLIVSAKAITDLVAFLQIFSADKIFFSHDEVNEQICFFNNQFSYFTKLINSNYPPFEKIIPLEFSTNISLDRQDFIKNLNKASVFSRFSNNVVKLSIKDDNLNFLANSLGDGTFKSEEKLINKTGEDLEIAFNIRYLLDFLTLATSDTITIGLNGHDHPILIRDEDNPSWQYVAMPFKPKG